MKSLGFILFGVIIAAFSANHFLDARAASSAGQASLWFVGIIAGVALGFYGLIANHRDHTRR